MQYYETITPMSDDIYQRLCPQQKAHNELVQQLNVFLEDDDIPQESKEILMNVTAERQILANIDINLVEFILPALRKDPSNLQQALNMDGKTYDFEHSLSSIFEKLTEQKWTKENQEDYDKNASVLEKTKAYLSNGSNLHISTIFKLIFEERSLKLYEP